VVVEPIAHVELEDEDVAASAKEGERVSSSRAGETAKGRRDALDPSLAPGGEVEEEGEAEEDGDEAGGEELQ